METKHLKLVILAILITSFGYWSCQKENAPLSTTTVTTDSQQRESTQATNSEEIKAKIEVFERTLTNLKNGENTDVSMSVDETVWNIEALLNKTYGWVNFQYATSDTKTSKIPIEQTDNFTGEQVVTLYNKSLEQLRIHNNSLESEPCRQLILADIDIQREEEKTFFTITSVFGTSTIENKSSDRNLPDVYNAFGRALPAAVDCPSSPISPTILTNSINAVRYLPSGYSYLTNIEYKVGNGSTFENTNTADYQPGTQRRRYLMYYCSTHKEMNNVLTPIPEPLFKCYPSIDHDWYLDKIKNQVIPILRPGSKWFSHCDIYDGGLSYTKNGIKVTQFYHTGYFFYGVPTQGNPCCPSPI